MIIGLLSSLCSAVLWYYVVRWIWRATRPNYPVINETETVVLTDDDILVNEIRILG